MKRGGAGGGDEAIERSWLPPTFSTISRTLGHCKPHALFSLDGVPARPEKALLCVYVHSRALTETFRLRSKKGAI